ncbi:MAG: MFS transporter, partial [Erysipelotrichaceae bacterium]
SIGFTFVGLYVSAYSVQYAAYFQGTLKFDASVIGITGSFFAICSLLGNVLGGSLFDKLGALKCLILSATLVSISGVFLLLSKNNVIFAHAFSSVKGLAVFAYMIGPAYLTGSFFGNKEYGSILGIVQLLFAVGVSSGSALFGVLVGKVGYDMSWILMFGVVAIAYTLLISATIGMNKQNKKNSSITAA